MLTHFLMPYYKWDKWDITVEASKEYTHHMLNAFWSVPARIAYLILFLSGVIASFVFFPDKESTPTKFVSQSTSCLPQLDRYLSLKPGMTATEVERRVGKASTSSTIRGGVSQQARTDVYPSSGRLSDVRVEYNQDKTVTKVIIVAKGFGQAIDGVITKSFC